MVKERNYLIETLKSSGIKSQVYTNMKKLKAGNEVHVGAVLRNGETFARSGSKKTYIDQEGQRKMCIRDRYIPIEEIQSTVNKVLRIESLQPVIKNKYLKFNREHKTLLKQLQEFPMGKNDDAPDGLQTVSYTHLDVYKRQPQGIRQYNEAEAGMC